MHDDHYMDFRKETEGAWGAIVNANPKTLTMQLWA